MTTYRNGKTYWINGQNRSDRNHIAQKLRDFLKTERKNWRRDVFYIDSATFDCDYDTAFQKILTIADYISSEGVDVVIGVNIPTKGVKDVLKLTLDDRFIDVLIWNTKKKKSNVIYDETYETVSDYSISIDTTTDTPSQIFNKLICELRNMNFL
jgi:hypothetical protein